MTYRFEAGIVALDRDGDVFIVGLADDPKHPERFLIIQYRLKYSDEDKRDGCNKPYFEIEDQSRSVYGGIVEVRLSRNRIHLKTDEEADRHLRIDGDIEISFGDTLFDFGGLAAAFETISEVFGIPVVHEYPRLRAPS